MSLGSVIDTNISFQLVTKQHLFSNKSSKKQFPKSSAEQNSEQESEARKQMSLRLFQGFKQLEDPVPYHQELQSKKFIEEMDQAMTHCSLKGFRPSNMYRELFSFQDVRNLVGSVIESCFSFMRIKMQFQQKSIHELERKIFSLSNLISSLPLQFMKMQNHRQKLSLEKKFVYEKEIKQLKIKIIDLEKNLNTSKSYVNQPFKSLPQKIHITSPEQYLTPVAEFIEDPDERSLLEEVEEDLANSSLRENSKHEASFSLPITYSQKIVNEPGQMSEQTVKKRHESIKVGFCSRDGFETTNKKSQVIPDSIQRLMSFSKNTQVEIVEEQIFSEGSDAVDRTGEKDKKILVMSQLEKQNRTKFNPQRSLNFGSPIFFQNQVDSQPYDESDVQEFSIQDSNKNIQRLSISKRKVPSLLQQAQSPTELLLSKQEKYLLQEIKQLRKIVQWEEETIVEEVLDQSRVKRLKGLKMAKARKKQTKNQYLKVLDELSKTETRQQQLLELLNRTKTELNNLRSNLHILLPCQYCELQNGLRSVIM